MRLIVSIGQTRPLGKTLKDVSPMIPLQSFTTGVLGEVIRRQPSSPARTAFAWQLAVGTPMARATAVELRGDVLVVRPRDPRWGDEIHMARETILARLRPLIGVRAIEVRNP